MRISDWSSDVCSSDLSLAYDDALDSQLDNAIPALDRHGFHASFYLPLAADTLRTRLDEWRAAAARGHELGNHTLFHQCSRSEEHTSELQSLMRISYAVFCLKKKTKKNNNTKEHTNHNSATQKTVKNIIR